MNMYIWEIATLNQLFIRGSYTQIKSSKNNLFSGKTERKRKTNCHFAVKLLKEA